MARQHVFIIVLGVVLVGVIGGGLWDWVAADRAMAAAITENVAPGTGWGICSTGPNGVVCISPDGEVYILRLALEPRENRKTVKRGNEKLFWAQYDLVVQLRARAVLEDLPIVEPPWRRMMTGTR